MDIEPSLTDELLDRWPIARVSTITADGRPHVVPAVFVRLEDAVYLPVDGKQKRHTRLQRFKNVAANPVASLLLDHYADDWAQLWWVRIDGAASACNPAGEQDQALSAKLRAKYPQYQVIPMADKSLSSGSRYLRVAIDSMTCWAQSGSAASIRASLAALRNPSESR